MLLPIEAAQKRGAYIGLFTKATAIPVGYSIGAAAMVPYYPGATSGVADLSVLRYDIAGAGAMNAPNLAGGLNGAAPLTGTGTISSANLGLIISATAALTGSATLSASVVGSLNAAAALTGTGDVTAALGALASMIASLNGSGDVAATPSATGSMSAGITVTGELLTTANVADAVWASICEGNYTRDDLLKIIAAALAGKTSGQPSSPVFRNASDTQDTITATVDEDGNRTAVTLTP